MRLDRQIIVLDAANLAAESTFWASMMDGVVEADDDWHTINVDGKARLAIQLAPDHEPPQWPDGSPQQVHFDFYVDDIRSAHDEAMRHGAKLLQEADDLDSDSGFQVYADPAGHPFCLCWT